MGVVTELSGMPPLARNETAFNVYVTHQTDQGRADSYGLVVAEDLDSLKGWLFEDTKLVDLNVKPVSDKEYHKMRLNSAVARTATTFLRLRAYEE